MALAQIEPRPGVEDPLGVGGQGVLYSFEDVCVFACYCYHLINITIISPVQLYFILAVSRSFTGTDGSVRCEVCARKLRVLDVRMSQLASLLVHLH